ncbi:MAG: amino acid permease [Candidatus Aenigmarchaeota archaeon]|nr:amino acid permease [Candidatus Aenigmarchaeota archaeon]
MAITKKLSMFDVTNLVVGAIVGADIYIAASFGVGLLGPASLLAWVVAGVFAIIIALTFGRCAEVIKQVGGPYAYAKHAFGHFSGFMTGWSLWIAEIAALSVFPIAFIVYLSFFIHVSFLLKLLVTGLFIAFLFATNYFGIKNAARTNDVLTLVKLAPLFLLVTAGLLWMFSKPAEVAANLTPFAPLGFENFGLAVVIIFWAYAGFEYATVVSSDIKNAKKVLPRAILSGMLIVLTFYLLTNFVIVGVAEHSQLINQATPLTYVSYLLMGGVGAAIMAIGAMISLSGSNESGLMGSTRLAYAMAADGYFPKRMADVRNKYSTPHVALGVHCVIMFFAAILFTAQMLITFVVFNLAFAYLMVALSSMKLRKDKATKVLATASLLIAFYLITQNALFVIFGGAALLLLGIPIYVFFAPKTEIKRAKALLFKEENMLKHRVEKEEVFLARVVKQIKLHIRKRDEFYRKEKKSAAKQQARRTGSSPSKR